MGHLKETKPTPWSDTRGGVNEDNEREGEESGVRRREGRGPKRANQKTTQKTATTRSQGKKENIGNRIWSKKENITGGGSQGGKAKKGFSAKFRPEKSTDVIIERMKSGKGTAEGRKGYK